LLSAAELGAQLHDDEIAMTPARIEWLLAQGADPWIRNARGDTPLFALLDRGAATLPSLHALLARGVSPAGAGGLARFLGACAGGDRPSPDWKPARLTCSSAAPIPSRHRRPADPPLALAVRLGWPRLVERLLAIGVALDSRDSHGMSALHLAAALSRELMLKQL